MLKLMIRGSRDQAVVVADSVDEDDHRRWGFVVASNQLSQEELRKRHEERMQHEQEITEAL